MTRQEQQEAKGASETPTDHFREVFVLFSFARDYSLALRAEPNACWAT
jgi:hypothetical protein